MGATVTMEWRKFHTTRVWWLLGIVMVGYVGLLAGLLGLAPSISSQSPIDPSDPSTLAPVYRFAPVVASVFPLVLGALATTSDERWSTAAATYLVQPRRVRVLLAKAIVLCGVGAGFGVVATAVCVGGLSGALALTGTRAVPGAELLPDFASGVAAFGLWAVIGVGVGAVLNNQVAAVVGVVAFTQLVEPVVRSVGSAVPVLQEVTAYLPGAAGESASGGSVLAAVSPDSALSAPAGALVLAAYAAVLLVVGAVLTRRREV